MMETKSTSFVERRKSFRRSSDKKMAEDNEALKKRLAAIEKEMQNLERLKPLATIASSVVHDVRNSLGIIASTAQFVLNRLDPPEKMKQHWEMVMRNVEIIQKILKGYMGIAQQTETKELSSINEIIERVCRYLDAQSRHKNIKLEKNLESSLPHLLLDISAIESAVLNISLNAFDAIENSGTLKFTTKTDARKEKVIVEIEDTGAGISEEHLSKIFSPFFTTKKSGTGMGLYSAKAIVENNNGKISCESKVGRGTRMILSFSPEQRKK